MFKYLTPENALIMQHFVFLAVVGVFKIVELLINRRFFTLQFLIIVYLAFLLRIYINS